nr:hypothetical protein Iba_chr01fCG8320 [Ipomoea batatas]
MDHDGGRANSSRGGTETFLAHVIGRRIPGNAAVVDTKRYRLKWEQEMFESGDEVRMWFGLKSAASVITSGQQSSVGLALSLQETGSVWVIAYCWSSSFLVRWGTFSVECRHCWFGESFALGLESSRVNERCLLREGIRYSVGFGVFVRTRTEWILRVASPAKVAIKDFGIDVIAVSIINEALLLGFAEDIILDDPALYVATVWKLLELL